MRVSAKADFAIRAVLELADSHGHQPVPSDQIADGQAIPVRLLEPILAELQDAGLIESDGGAAGGYRLARAPGDVAVADVICAVDGPLVRVGGVPPQALALNGVAGPMRDVWIAARAAVRDVLEHVSLADVVGGELPSAVRSRLRSTGGGSENAD